MKTLRLALFSTAFAALAATAFAGYSESEKFSQSYPITANGALRLSNINGAVDITAWDKNEVLVEAEKLAQSTEDLARIHIEIEPKADSIAIKSVHDKTGFFKSDVRGEVRYHIKVPAGATLERIASVNSGLTISGVHGAVNLATVNGSIRASDLSSDAKLDTVNGSVRAQFETVTSGQHISIASVNGSCEVKLPADVGAHIELSSVNGSTSCEFPITLERGSRHSLRGDIGTGSASVRASTVNGGIKIAKR